MRVDIREETIRVAEAELRENNCYIVLVSKAIVERRLCVSQFVVQLTASSEGGMAELIVREVSNQERDPA